MFDQDNNFNLISLTLLIASLLDNEWILLGEVMCQPVPEVKGLIKVLCFWIYLFMHSGASEPKNMAYMSRLGIWGPGTPFREFNDFIQAVERRLVHFMLWWG